MTTPKQVSHFAKEYVNTYIEVAQLRATVKELNKEVKRLRKRLKI